MDTLFTIENIQIYILFSFILGALLTKLSNRTNIINQVQDIINSCETSTSSTDTFIKRNEQLKNIIYDKELQLEKLNKDIDLLKERQSHIKSSSEFKQMKELDSKLEKLKKLKSTVQRIKSHQEIFNSSILTNLFKELYELHYEQSISDIDLKNQIMDYADIDKSEYKQTKKSSSNTINRGI